MSEPDDLRSRLEALNRARLEGRLVPGTAVPARQADHEVPTRLEDVAPGRAIDGPAGTCYQVSARVSLLGPKGRDLVRQYPVALAAARASPALYEDLAGLAAGPPDTALFVDLETCGFAGNPLFLVGAMWWDRDDFHIAQLLARDYSEEKAVTHAAAGLVAARPVLVSFNGKSFDWPMLRERAAVNRVSMPEPQTHCDLLHVSRRVWPSLPNHRLTTLETSLCRRRRTGDIDGAAIPEAYHGFVRTGDARIIGDILRHNLWDLMTLAELVARMLADPSGP